MTQEEHILCEIEEFKIELQQSIDRTRRLERFIREKETELYYCRMKSGKHSLFRSIQDSGFSSVENCRKICEIVKNWIPPALDGNGEYSDAWNDYREEILRNLT
jgi:hypothetical protein